MAVIVDGKYVDNSTTKTIKGQQNTNILSDGCQYNYIYCIRFYLTLWPQN